MSGLVPSRPRLLQPEMGAGAATRLTFPGREGTRYEILAAPDPTLPLANWMVLGAASSVGPGLLEFIDQDASRHAKRFYRVRSQ